MRFHAHLDATVSRCESESVCVWRKMNEWGEAGDDGIESCSDMSINEIALRARTCTAGYRSNDKIDSFCFESQQPARLHLASAAR